MVAIFLFLLLCTTQLLSEDTTRFAMILGNAHMAVSLWMWLAFPVSLNVVRKPKMEVGLFGSNFSKFICERSFFTNFEK